MPDSFSRRFITKKIGGKLVRFVVEDSKNARMNANNLMNTAQSDVGDYLDDLNQAGLIDGWTKSSLQTKEKLLERDKQFGVNLDSLPLSYKKRRFPMIVGGQTCNKCKGKGYIDDHICGYCAGIGRTTNRWIGRAI